MARLSETTASAMRMAPSWQPRTLALISLASAGVLTYGALIPLREEIDPPVRVGVIVFSVLAGLLYLATARYFRNWMMYLAVGVGLLADLIVLVAAVNEFGLMLVLTTVLWICLLIGLAFPPRVTRTFAILVCLGMVFAETVNPVPHGAEVSLLFAASCLVTMETLTRMTTRLRAAAATDPLTGFLNRGGLERQLTRVRGFRRDQEVSLLLADLDGFKEVNDRDGHLEGDRLLREFAASWRENLRAGDLIARIGGDEFVIVSPVTDPVAARGMVARLKRVSPLEWSGGLVISESGESLESMIARADRLMYAEKDRKRERRS